MGTRHCRVLRTKDDLLPLAVQPLIDDSQVVDTGGRQALVRGKTSVGIHDASRGRMSATRCAHGVTRFIPTSNALARFVHGHASRSSIASCEGSSQLTPATASRMYTGSRRSP